MLEKLIIHLKNIIFFKSVTYLTIIILLALAIPKLQEQLEKSIENKKKAQNFLQQAALQLNSILEFEDKIAETNTKFEALVANSSKEGCSIRKNLANDLKILSQKYSLAKPIKIETFRLFDTNSDKNKTSDISLQNFEVFLDFNVNSEQQLIELCKDICSILPKGTIIEHTEIKRITVLTPQIISDLLASTTEPGLIQVSMKLHLREILYNR